MEETVERLGCSKRKVFLLLEEGALKRGKSLGRCTLVRVDSIETLEASLLPRPTPSRAARPVLPRAMDEAELDAEIARVRREILSRHK